MPSKSIPTSKFNSLLQLSQHLSNEKKCLKFIEQWRWNGEIHCPHCGMDKIYKYESREIFKCASCQLQFSAKVKTIFEKSKVPLKKWILAIYLNGANKKGISSHQLAKEIEVSQKTAWFMLHRIRKALQPEYKEKLEGVIMTDETFVGGKNKNRHIDKKFVKAQGRSFKDKVPVMGIMQKGGEIRCMVIPDTTNNSLFTSLKDHVKDQSIVVTDEYRNYKGIRKWYNHQVVQHRFKRYKNDEGYSTNAVEGFWGHFKRTIIGIYHNISKKHLQRYVDEITFRYNTRNMKSGERFALTMAKINTRLTYKQLVYGT